jgi:hypothetical protein
MLNISQFQHQICVVFQQAKAPITLTELKSALKLPTTDMSAARILNLLIQKNQIKAVGDKRDFKTGRRFKTYQWIKQHEALGFDKDLVKKVKVAWFRSKLFGEGFVEEDGQKVGLHIVNLAPEEPIRKIEEGDDLYCLMKMVGSKYKVVSIRKTPFPSPLDELYAGYPKPEPLISPKKPIEIRRNPNPTIEPKNTIQQEDLIHSQTQEDLNMAYTKPYTPPVHNPMVIAKTNPDTNNEKKETKPMIIIDEDESTKQKKNIVVNFVESILKIEQLETEQSILQNKCSSLQNDIDSLFSSLTQINHKLAASEERLAKLEAGEGQGEATRRTEVLKSIVDLIDDNTRRLQEKIEQFTNPKKD